MKKVIKLLAIAVLLMVLGFGGLVFLAAPRPPKEAKLIQNFNEHRAAFEKLRDMLLSDTNLVRVANWGVQTRKPFFLGYPTGDDFPTDRFHEYLALLKEAGGMLASRDEGKHPDPSIVVWGWGWAGDTRHIGICWLDEMPTNQVATLDGQSGLYSEETSLFRHIDHQWYLWEDW